MTPYDRAREKGRSSTPRSGLPQRKDPARRGTGPLQHLTPVHENRRGQRRTRARLMILKTSPAAVIVVAIVAMTTDISI
jgi:hypothetical protein